MKGKDIIVVGAIVISSIIGLALAILGTRGGK